MLFKKILSSSIIRISLSCLVFSLACIEWQMDPVHRNPLHITLFNFLGWQNIGKVDEALPVVCKNVHPSNVTIEGLDILFSRATSTDSLSEMAHNLLFSQAETIKSLFLTNPPSPEAPWYLVLKVQPTQEIFDARRTVLAAIPTTEIQEKYKNIPRFDTLSEQSTWKPHITLGRIVHIPDIDNFAKIFDTAITEAKTAITLPISADQITISTRQTGQGKKGKLVKILFLEQNYPVLYKKFRNIQRLF